MEHGLNTDCRSEECSAATGLSIVPTELTARLHQLDASVRQSLWHWEIAVLALILALLNIPLVTGEFSTRFIFHHDPVAAGEWWRLFTHPFVHVSPYHLALDAAAFFLAYVELQQLRANSRLTLFTVTVLGSLLAAVVASPLIATHGLCGLSGVAHGLTALVALETMRRSSDKLTRWTGLLCFIGVVGKGAWEAATGSVMFASWHLGSLGIPIAACHAGGVLGALVAWFLLHATKPENEGHIAATISAGDGDKSCRNILRSTVNQTGFV